MQLCPHTNHCHRVWHVWLTLQPLPIRRRCCLPLPPFSTDQINAKAAAELARSKKVPRGILNRANDIWRHEHPDEFYGNSYKAMDPKTYAVQQLGLITSTAIANHILRSYGKAKSRPTTSPKSALVGSLLKDDACYLSTDDVFYDASNNSDVRSATRQNLNSMGVVSTA